MFVPSNPRLGIPMQVETLPPCDTSKPLSRTRKTLRWAKMQIFVSTLCVSLAVITSASPLDFNALASDDLSLSSNEVENLISKLASQVKGLDNNAGLDDNAGQSASGFGVNAGALRVGTALSNHLLQRRRGMFGMFNIIPRLLRKVPRPSMSRIFGMFGRNRNADRTPEQIARAQSRRDFFTDLFMNWIFSSGNNYNGGGGGGDYYNDAPAQAQAQAAAPAVVAAPAAQSYAESEEEASPHSQVIQANKNPASPAQQQQAASAATVAPAPMAAAA
ncbi:hypothetical protein M8J76_000550 [Diaphorina citri]|nr:hypothetical protein M8J76_000550 [Diaphorina citri]